MDGSRMVDGIWVDPELPEGFWNPPEGDRPDSHLPYTSKPFIVSVPKAGGAGGHSFDVYWFHEQVWGRPMRMFRFVTLDEAIHYTKGVEYL